MNNLIEEKQYMTNNLLAKENIGWEPKWNIQETLSKVLSWYDVYYSGATWKKLCEQAAAHEAVH